MTVSLFIPCLTEHLYPESGLAMVRILKHLGYKIDYVDNQTCCGQPAFNSGYRREMIPVAERFIRLFQDKELIVAPSGSCVAMIRVFYDQLALDPSLMPGLKALKERLFELTEFLVKRNHHDKLQGCFPHRVTYHDSCHLSRELGVRQQPRQLIQSIKEIDFVEMTPPDLCCGFGGTFSYKFSDVSVEMVKRKCESIEATGAEYCIGADSSCLMNIEGYLRKHGMKAKTLHIAELLSRSLDLEKGAA
ncbi:(Fe-S)-binding protein [bacterium]|nr:(Fe-S)-binding protein [bacterium]